MAAEIEVYLPGETNPIDLDTYAVNVASVSAYGTSKQVKCLPYFFAYDNPKTSRQFSIGTPDMTRSN